MHDENTITLTDIQSKGVLVRCSVSMWGIKKNDGRMIKATAERLGISLSELGNSHKYLIDPKAESWQAICHARDAIRKVYYDYAIPWAHGIGLINVKALDAFGETMAELSTGYNEALAEFSEALPALIEAQRDKLTSKDTDETLFRESDYPPVSVIMSKFGFHLSYTPIPHDSHFDAIADVVGTDIAADMAETMVKEATSQWQAATRSVWDRLYKALKHAEKMLASGQRIHGSILGNLQELADVLPVLNIDNDADLELRRKDLNALLRMYNAESIKDKPTRNNCADEVTAILAKIGH